MERKINNSFFLYFGAEIIPPPYQREEKFLNGGKWTWIKLKFWEKRQLEKDDKIWLKSEKAKMVIAIRLSILQKFSDYLQSCRSAIFNRHFVLTKVQMDL